MSQGFFDFVRKQGVMGLAIGFVLGGAVSKVVTSLVSDLLNPLLGLVLGSTEGLRSVSVALFGAQFMVGNFIATVIDFLVIALVAYYIFKIIGIVPAKKTLPKS